MKNAVLLAILSLYALPGQALSGTLTVSVNALSTRVDVYGGPGIDGVGRRQAGRMAATVPLEGARVSLVITSNIGMVTSVCRATNASGVATIPWSITGVPIAASVIVRPIAFLDGPNVSCSATNWDFEVRTGTPGLAETTITLASVNVSPLSGTQTMPSVTVTGDAVNAYLTAVETLRMHDGEGLPFNGGPSLRQSMKGLYIFVGQPAGVAVAPRDNWVLLATTRPTLFPFTTAHKMGHILAWRSLDLAFANIYPTVDYMLDLNPSWGRTTHEFSKAVFHEGLADVHGALWMWHRSAPNPTIVTTGGPFPIETNATCTALQAPHERPICAATALWDVVDGRLGDDDPALTADLSDVVGVLRSYPRRCISPFDNRCNNEAYPWTPTGVDVPTDPHGNNWRDFAAQGDSSPNLTSAMLSNIEAAHVLGATPND